MAQALPYISAVASIGSLGSSIYSLFNKPKPPAQPAQTAPPTVDSTAGDAQKAIDAQRRVSPSTVVNAGGAMGLADDSQTVRRPSLLGA